MDINMKLTDWIAIYAAVLSTCVFIWQFGQGKPRVKVAVVPGVVDGDHGAYISVQNRSAHAVSISHCSFLYPGRKQTVWDWLTHAWQFRTFPRRLGWIHAFLPYDLDLKLPARLEPHDSLGIFIPEAKLFEHFQGNLEMMVVFKVQDALWKDYFTNEYHFGFPEFETFERSEPDNSDT